MIFIFTEAWPENYTDFEPPQRNYIDATLRSKWSRFNKSASRNRNTFDTTKTEKAREVRPAPNVKAIV